MFGFSSGILMNMSDDERQLAVSVISDCLRQSGGDSGKMMLDAYYLAVSETDPCVRECMLALLESVRIKYVTA